MPTNNIVKAKTYYVIAFSPGTTAGVANIEITFPPGYDVTNAKLIELTGITTPGTFSVSSQTLIYTFLETTLLLEQRKCL